MPDEPKFAWTRRLAHPGPGGIAATPRLVIVSDRDLTDTADVFHGLDAANGDTLWTLRYRATGRLDYGNSPRATPLIEGERAYLYDAHGDFHCVALATGKVLWKKNLRQAFSASDDIPWGVASSPLVVDGKLIVNPGGQDASLVALDPAGGQVIWQTPGAPAAFASFIVGTFGGRKQLVGYDKTTLGGWDIQTGRRLWRLEPPRKDDFNVPTPIAIDGRLLVCTENNGTRLYGFQSDGTIRPEPIAQHAELAPDTHTPIVLDNRLFGVWEKMFCLDLDNGLKTIWSSDDAPFINYTSIVGAGQRVLVTSQEGELILLDATANVFQPLSRLRLFADEAGVLAHPALVGQSLFVRGSSAVYRLDLAP